MQPLTVDQVGWVFDCIVKNGAVGGSFRNLIYNFMGFGPETYDTLYRAGGMSITNKMNNEKEEQCDAVKLVKKIREGLVFGHNLSERYYKLLDAEAAALIIAHDAAIRKECANRAIKLQIALCYPDRKEYAECHFCSRCSAIREAIEGEI